MLKFLAFWKSLFNDSKLFLSFWSGDFISLLLCKIASSIIVNYNQLSDLVARFKLQEIYFFNKGIHSIDKYKSNCSVFILPFTSIFPVLILKLVVSNCQVEEKKMGYWSMLMQYEMNQILLVLLSINLMSKIAMSLASIPQDHLSVL